MYSKPEQFINTLNFAFFNRLSFVELSSSYYFQFFIIIVGKNLSHLCAFMFVF